MNGKDFNMVSSYLDIQMVGIKFKLKNLNIK
jgi:hypothetical protein